MKRAHAVLCAIYPWGEEKAIVALEKAIYCEWQKPFEPTNKDIAEFKPQKERIPENVRAFLEKEAK